MPQKISGKLLVLFKSLNLKREISNLSYLHNVGHDPLRPLTMGQLLERISVDYGNRLALVSRDQKKQITFKEVLYQADQLAAGFYKLGFSRGDRVGLVAPNSLEWYVISMAFSRAGFILAPINPVYQAKELEYCINKMKIKGLIMAEKFKIQNFYELLKSICEELPNSQPGNIKSSNLPSLKNVVVLSDDKFSGCFTYSDIMNMANDEYINIVRKGQTQIKIDDPCNVQFTSGTTGKSKIAVISHFSIVNNGYFIGKRNELNTKHRKICCPNPLFHAFGTVIAISGSLNHAATLILPAEGYDPNKTLDTIKEENCCVIYGTPTMFVDLIECQQKRQEDINPDISLTGGASCSKELFENIMKVLRVKKVKSIYGLSETTASSFHSIPTDGYYESTSTVGYLQEHLEAKVVDKDNNIVPRGVPGELCIRGYSNMLEYLDDPEKTEEIMGKNRWLHTGDQFIMDDKGYGKIIGRIKEMIIRGGENIYPKEIEDFLQTHPDIVEAQVIGLPHERLGEEVCVCVRLRQEAKLTLDDLKRFCKGKISHFKIPSVLKIRTSFPTTTSGKVQKNKLRDQILSKSLDDVIL